MAIKFEKKNEGTYKLDCCGYVCPHPQIYTKKMLEKLNPGEELEVIFDNPSSSESITAMISGSSSEIVGTSFEGGKFLFRIQKNQ